MPLDLVATVVDGVPFVLRPHALKDPPLELGTAQRQHPSTAIWVGCGGFRLVTVILKERRLLVEFSSVGRVPRYFLREITAGFATRPLDRKLVGQTITPHVEPEEFLRKLVGVKRPVTVDLRMTRPREA